MSTQFNHLGALAAALGTWQEGMVERIAQNVATHAEENAPELTGHLKSTIYVSGPKGSTYGQGVVGSGELLPEERPQSKGEAIVGVAASYGLYPEYGTAHNAPHPYMTPAADDARTLLEDEARHLEEQLATVK